MDYNNTLLVFSQLMAMAFALPAFALLWTELVRLDRADFLEYSIAQVEHEAHDFNYGDFVAEEWERITVPENIDEAQVFFIHSLEEAMERGRELADRYQKENEMLDCWEHLMGCQLI